MQSCLFGCSSLSQSRLFLLTVVSSVMFSTAFLFFTFKSNACTRTDSESADPFYVSEQSQINRSAINLVAANASSERLLLQVAQQNLALNGKVLILTLSNSGHYGLVLNWARHLQKGGFKRFLIVCIDDELFARLERNGLRGHLAMMPMTWLRSEVTPRETSWGQKKYFTLTQTKIVLVSRLLEYGFQVLLSDDDVVWLSPHVLKVLEYTTPSFAEFIYSVDKVDNGYSEIKINTGFYWAKPTPNVRKLFRDVLEEQERKPNLPDGECFVNVVHGQNLQFSRWFWSLDMLLFTNGKTLHMDAKTKEFGIRPLVFHANWFIGIRDKVRVMRENKMWLVNASDW